MINSVMLEGTALEVQRASYETMHVITIKLEYELPYNKGYGKVVIQGIDKPELSALTKGSVVRVVGSITEDYIHAEHIAVRGGTK